MVHGLEELAGIKRSGIYALSVPCMKEPKLTKIGKAKDLGARIDQYQLYFPFGVAIELLWIFPKSTRGVDAKLLNLERAIHAQLNPVHTTARRKRTEWFWDSKKELATAFLQATEIFPDGILVNPAFHFSVLDKSAEEANRNSKARTAQTHSEKEHAREKDSKRRQMSRAEQVSSHRAHQARTS